MEKIKGVQFYKNELSKHLDKKCSCTPNGRWASPCLDYQFGLRRTIKELKNIK